MTRRVQSKAWLWAGLAALVAGGFLRFYRLDIRPLHHDEGVNSLFLKNLISSNSYRYDPTNYHGPSLYYFQMIPSWMLALAKDGIGNFSFHSLSGMTVTSLRSLVAVTGTLLLAAILLTSTLIGPWGAAAACALAAFSCDFIFYSRYFIHEIFVVLFTFGVYFGIARWLRKEKPGAFYVAVISAALLFCTKETSIPTLVILALAAICAETTHWLIDGCRPPGPVVALDNRLMDALSKLRWHVLGGLAVAGLIWMSLFSSFFKDPHGLWDSFRTFFFWGKQGIESGHDKRFMYYIEDILIRYELALVVFSFLGIMAAFIKAEKKGLILAFWTLGIAGFYSLVPYKTPWLIINLLLPMALISGYGIQAAIDHIRVSPDVSRKRVAAGTVCAGFLFLLGLQFPQALRVNYVEYDYEKHPMVYVHTTRDIFNLLNEIDGVAARSGQGNNLSINVVSEDYWPLPFYLMKYKSALFWGRFADVHPLDAPVIIAEPKQQDGLQPLLKDSYSVHTYALRPGVTLLLYINDAASGRPPSKALELTTSEKISARLAPGLNKVVFKGMDFSGDPLKKISGDNGFDFNWNDDSQKPLPAPFSMRWTGDIKIDAAGLYRFALESDDGSWLFIDGKLLIDNGGLHGTEKVTRAARLSAGYHKIEIKYFDAGGGAILHFYWTPPQGPEAIAPKNIFFHHR